MFQGRGESLGSVVLSLRDVVAPGLRHPVSLDLRRGEILGLVGQLGSGATAVVRAVAGIVPRGSGEITMHGQTLVPRTARDAIAAGIAYCSDDHKRDGIFGVRN